MPRTFLLDMSSVTRSIISVQTMIILLQQLRSLTYTSRGSVKCVDSYVNRFTLIPQL